MRNKRSTQLLLLGAAVFIVGSGLAFASLRPAAQQPAQPAPHAAKTAAAPVTAPQPATVARQSGAVVAIPAGKQAVAVDLPSVAGLAGYAKPGDLVNVYATVKNSTDPKVTVPQAKLVLRAVRVLDVRQAPQGTAASTTFLLALNETEAERLIFFGKFESLWFTLVPPGQTPGKTAGHTYRNAL